MQKFLNDANNYLRALPGAVKSTICLTIILCIVCVIIGHKIKKVDSKDKTPLWLTPIFMFVDILNRFVRVNIGKRWKIYTPYFMALIIFLFVANTCSIFGITNPTSYVVLNFGLSIITFLIVQITGFVSNGPKEYLKGFLGPTIFLSPLLLPINIIGDLALPFSLALRLFGNILSGNVLAKLIVGFSGYWCIPFLWVFNIVFDIAFGIIQTAVFSLLTMIFTSMKIKDEEKIYNN